MEACWTRDQPFHTPQSAGIQNSKSIHEFRRFCIPRVRPSTLSTCPCQPSLLPCQSNFSARDLNFGSVTVMQGRACRRVIHFAFSSFSSHPGYIHLILSCPWPLLFNLYYFC